ncbi:MAG: 7-carboxy-7-deazaguanine synthase QueE [Candidatus Kapaibacteriales bacterium]
MSEYLQINENVELKRDETSLTDAKNLKSQLKEGFLNVNEIYLSLQGEGTRSGLLTTFVRLQGCLLRCVWCDTPYALERSESANIMSRDELYHSIEKRGCKLIMFTGGEPLEQPGVFPLIVKLCDNGYEVTIETNGQADVSEVDKRAVLIMDLKCPDSGMHKKNRYSNLDSLKKGDEVKFVISSRRDYDWTREIIKQYNIYSKVDTVLLSPAFGILDSKELAEWMISDKINARMQLQSHKYIWDPNRRGV